jgi:hypothetical protein
MKVRVERLVGDALDWAMAKATGFNETLEPFSHWVDREGAPARDWAKGGPLIQAYRIAVFPRPGFRDGSWAAEVGHVRDSEKCYSTGPTPLAAAAHCFLLSRCGSEIELPEVFRPSVEG